MRHHYPYKPVPPAAYTVKYCIYAAIQLAICHSLTVSNYGYRVGPTLDPAVKTGINCFMTHKISLKDLLEEYLQSPYG